MANSDVSIRIGADASQLDSALSAAKSSVGSFSSEVTSKLGGLAGSFSSLQGAISGIGSALAGVAVGGALAGFVSGFEKLTSRAVEMQTLAASVGVTVEQFQTMRLAADEAGVPIETLSRATEKLSIALSDAREHSGTAIAELHRLGITNEQLHDPTFTIVQLLGVLRAKLTDASTSAAEHDAVLKVLGLRMGQAAEGIKILDLSLQGVAKAMDKVSGLTDEENKKLVAAHAAWSAFGENIENQFSKALISATKFLTQLDKITDASIRWAQNQVRNIEHPFDALKIAAFTPPAASTAAVAPDQATAQQAATAAAQASAAAQIAASKQVTVEMLGDLKDQINATQQGSAQRLALVKQYYAESRQFYGDDRTSEVRAAHAELLSEERAYQAARLALEKQTTSELNAATRAAAEMVKRGLEESKTTLALMLDDAKSNAKQLEDVNVGAMNRAIERLHAESAEHRITSQEELADTKTLIDAEWQQWQKYYAQHRAWEVAAGVSTKETDIALEAEHQKYLDALQKADKKYDTERLADWKQLGQSMQTSLASNLTAMIEGQKTFGQAMKSLFSTLLDAWIQMLVKLGIQWVTTSLMGSAASKTAASSEITDNAATAGSAATASAAAIPVYGWAIAPEAGAEAYGAAMGYAGGLSAYGGFDVPEHVNPRVQLHQREMVLPEQYADVIRGMSGRGSGGGDVHHHHHYGPSLDAKSFHQYVHTPAAQDSIASALQTTYNRGRRPK